MTDGRNQRLQGGDVSSMLRKCEPARGAALATHALLARVLAPCDGDLLEDGIRLAADELQVAVEHTDISGPLLNVLHAIETKLRVLADLRRDEVNALNK